MDQETTGVQCRLALEADLKQIKLKVELEHSNLAYVAGVNQELKLRRGHLL